MTAAGASGRTAPELGESPRRRGGGAAAPAALWAFAFLLLRVFAVSGYNWHTAFLVTTTFGVDDGLALVFGSFMAQHLMVALVLVPVLPLLIATFLWSPQGRRSAVVLSSGLGLVTLVALTISFHLWWLPPAASAVFGTLALVRRLPSGRPLRRTATAITTRVWWVAAASLLVAAVAVQTPWVPKERIETTDGTIYGYVLSVDPGYLNVLTEDHEFIILISGDVLSRS